MNDSNPPIGIRRLIVVSLAYVRIGFWLLKEMNPWRRSYGKRR